MLRIKQAFMYFLAIVLLTPSISMNVAAMEEVNTKQTTVEDMKQDEGNHSYLFHVTKIMKKIKKPPGPEFNHFLFEHFRSQRAYSGLTQISLEIGKVCQKIYWSNEIKWKKKFRMCPHPVQVLTILRLADEILNGEKSKGAIAEIKTGEGKSFIIAVLSIVLSKFNRKIDIVTSNLELAKRDQEDQKMYYDLFGLNSGVLYNRNTDKNFNFLEKESPIQTMDDGDYNLDVFNCPVIYSTNSHYEFVYLHSLFKRDALRTRPYDIVLVDEVDNMLLDQAMCPAMIARPISIINGEDIFKIVYTMKNC